MECDTSSFPDTGPNQDSDAFEHVLTPLSLQSELDSQNQSDVKFDDRQPLLASGTKHAQSHDHNMANGARTPSLSREREVKRSKKDRDPLRNEDEALRIRFMHNLADAMISDMFRSFRHTASLNPLASDTDTQNSARTSLDSQRIDTESRFADGEYQERTPNQSATPETAPSFRQTIASPASISRTSSDLSSRKTSKYSVIRDSLIPSPAYLEAPPRIRSSIPVHLASEEYARQCVLAAYSSRLNPFALHQSEHKLLRDRINKAQTTIYLNIRNGILRLWTRNPMVFVTKAEAFGCAKDPRYFGLASFAQEWLARHGYINFGCLEPQSLHAVKRGRGQLPKGKVIIVIGAGISGLTCARQIQSLLKQFEHRLAAAHKGIPRVILVEGRSRIGGRVYSHPLRNQTAGGLPSGLRGTAEMGAQIITGFEHGNPLNILIRGQLALHYHTLKDNLIIHDFNGEVIEERQDAKIQALYNEILERASTYSWEPARPVLTEGVRNLIEYGRDPPSPEGPSIARLEHYLTNGVPIVKAAPGPPKSASGEFPATTESLTSITATQIRKLPFPTKPFPIDDSASRITHHGHFLTNPNEPVNGSPATLGAMMDEYVGKYQQSSGLTPQELRLLNWHYANLEYSNAAKVDQLSLGGWDQDGGNEFDGQHAEVVGGYSQVAQGLFQHPAQLSVRFDKAIQRVEYTANSDTCKPLARVICDTQEAFDADYVVSTIPLGILKSNSISFDPPLPKTKTGAIKRLGFGLLNKVILVFDHVFWDKDRDMFGMLNQSMVTESLEQPNYVSQRGKFYLFWNCIKTSGRPMLVALMAGEAAHEAERTADQTLIDEVTTRLAKAFSLPNTPVPQEAIVTRWKKDRFSKGSYSYLGPSAEPGDYDRMAEPVGNLYFAGEATCGTHPATVHGAFLSGLRAASEVVASIIGPIPPPDAIHGMPVEFNSSSPGMT